MRKVLLMLTSAALAALLTGCGGENGIRPEPTERTGQNDPTIGQLSSTIGDTSAIKRSGMLSSETLLQAADDYGPRTEVWFRGVNNLGPLNHFSAGEQQAGTDVGAGFDVMPNVGQIRFQLTSRTADGKRDKLIGEYTAVSGETAGGRADFSVKLPEQPNVNYLLSIEMLAADGKVEDTLLSALYVPYEEINAELSVGDANEDEMLTRLKLYNAGPTDLFFGKGYALYSYEDGDAWSSVPGELAVESIGIIVSPGHTYEEKVYYPSRLAPGRYRLVKEISGHNTSLDAKLAAEFTIYK